MQKPDADGFVTINWPSRNIPHGGIFHTHVANPTEDQRQLLKVLLEESRLTLSQNQKNALALRQKEEEKKSSQQPQVRRPMIRPRTSRRRSLSEIRESGAFDFDKYFPQKRGEDRELMKERLANKMTYGDTPEQPGPKVPPPTKKQPKLPSNKEKWNELVTQIRERTEWLAEMEYLGHADPHRDIIKDQIAERMRALDTLGVDSECSTTRSSASGFSTRSKVPVSAVPSEHSTNRSDKGGKMASARVTGRARTKEENVSSYSQLSPLQYSPRRRQ